MLLRLFDDSEPLVHTTFRSKQGPNAGAADIDSSEIGDAEGVDTANDINDATDSGPAIHAAADEASLKDGEDALMEDTLSVAEEI